MEEDLDVVVNDIITQLKGTTALTKREPVNIEPLFGDVTTNPKLGDTDAVTDPDLISTEIRASSVRAFLGIFLK